MQAERVPSSETGRGGAPARRPRDAGDGDASPGPVSDDVRVTIRPGAPARAGGRAAAGTPAPSAADVRAVRRFNRYYTRRIDLLDETFLCSGFTLAEARVLYEVANSDGPTAADLSERLGIDQAYLSRMLARFDRRKLVRRTRSAQDSRKSHLRLTAAGRAALVPLDRAAREHVEGLLAPLSGEERADLVASMRRIERLLTDRRTPGGRFRIRQHRPGDLGWVVERHGAVYAVEQAWDLRFEGYVAAIAAEFAVRHDPRRERLWIAEAGGERAGSVLLVAKSHDVAQLRLLLVEPWARGRGLGGRLVAHCVSFARRAGYRRVVLWTEAGLTRARRLYESAGFTREAEEQEDRFGRPFTAQLWELELR